MLRFICSGLWLIKHRLSPSKSTQRGFVKLLGLLVLGSMTLSACGVYNGYPTATALPPTPTLAPDTVTSQATAAISYPTPTPEPPFPTATPRPTLPPASAILTTTDQALVVEAYNDIFDNFYHTVSSADLYEVGLHGLSDTLKQAGIKDPQVPVPDFTGDRTRDADLFSRAYLLTLDRYKGQISEDTLAYGAIEAVTTGLQECHTTFYPPDQATAYYARRRGLDSQAGLGVLLVPATGSGLVVSHVLPQSPAANSGLKAGDTIIQVNGQALADKKPAEALDLLRGNSQSTAQTQLKVQRANSSTTDTVTLTRGRVTTVAIESQIINNDTGYIRFNAFPIQSDAGLTSALQQLDQIITDFNNKNVKGIVIDVRGNANGNIRTVQAYVSRFVTGNELVYLRMQADKAGSGSSTPTPDATVSSDQANVIQPMPSTGSVKPFTKQLALLVDTSTAGEAEIFALALQNQKVARLFGTDTAGCTSASYPFVLANNAVLNVAIYRPVSDPNDPASTVDAVKPDEVVPFDVKALQQGHDVQLDKAVQFLESK